MTKNGLIGLAILAVAAVATVGTPSKAEAHGYYRRYAPAVYPAYRPVYRSCYAPRPVVYTTPYYYSAPVVYAPAPVVYSQPVYYSQPYYSQPYYYGTGVNVGYYGNGRSGYGGVSFRVGF